MKEQPDGSMGSVETPTQRGFEGSRMFPSPSECLQISPRAPKTHSFRESLPCGHLHPHTDLAVSLLAPFSFPAGGASLGKG